MYRTIIVPVATDHSDHTVTALEIARKLLDKGGKIIAVHAVEPVPSYVVQFLPEGQIASAHTQAAEALRHETGGAADIEHVVIDGPAGRAITDFATRRSADLIVIASHKPGLQDYFLGSTAGRVVRHAACAVHVVR